MKNKTITCEEHAWLVTFFQGKLSLDEDYERDTCEENEADFDPDLFMASEVSEQDARKILDTLKAMETKIKEDDELADYLNECDRDTGWELYLSTSGHGAGFFDHSTKEADKIQALLDEHFQYETENWHFYCQDGELGFQD